MLEWVAGIGTVLR